MQIVFRRSLLASKTYACRLNVMCGTMNGINRCRACRFDRCVLVGMNLRAIQFPASVDVAKLSDKVSTRRRYLSQKYGEICPVLTGKTDLVVEETIESKIIRSLVYVRKIYSPENPKQNVLAYADQYPNELTWPLTFAEAVKMEADKKRPRWIMIDMFLCMETARTMPVFSQLDYNDQYSTQNAPDTIEVFDKELTPEAYNEWVIRNNYSKQAPLQDQIASTESTQNVPNGYWLFAYAHYKDPNHRELRDRTRVFYARAELNDHDWPLFQHFVRLATDPFIYIHNVRLTDQICILNLLSGAINSDHDRLQCKDLTFNLYGNDHKSITWAKTHMRCNQFTVWGKGDLNHDEALLDFFLTGAQCTSEVKVNSYDLSKVLVDFVQKFMDLKDSDGSQLVEAFEGDFKSQATESLNRDYAKFLVKEKRGRHINTHIFEFVNDNIGKKLQLTAKNYGHLSEFSIKITNL
ncbi:nuclear hormone receptor family member nhr-1 [Ditylenchus destructor]|uniref:Nuclear hormone receptor family member nhr-1 n=1 Tax=Ditylenchus destructor TaxID=166010 RepID=A0AAD4QTL4_9BILA|nr:nuclear hormone receptor family member nhr-1 [Ditylenchus destructor]